METALGILFSLPTIIFCIVLYLATLIIRRLVELAAKPISKIFPDKWEPWWVCAWKDWILPGLPVLLGGLSGWLITTYPYPEAIGTSTVAHIGFGVVCGWASGYVYRSAKALIKKVLPQKEAEQVEGVLNKVDNNDIPTSGI